MITIKNITIQPQQVPNDGHDRCNLRCFVFTPTDQARIMAVKIDLSPLGGVGAYQMTTNPQYSLSETAEGEYICSIDIALHQEPGEYELLIYAVDSEGGSGNVKVKLEVVYRRPEYFGGPTTLQNRKSLEQIAGRPIEPGNHVEVLIDGSKAFAKRLELIQGAQKQINLETYYLSDEGESKTLLEALLQKAEAGVEVNVILNSDTQLPSSPLGTLQMKFHNFLLELQQLGKQLEKQPEPGEQRDWRKLLGEIGQGRRGMNTLLFSGQTLRDAGIIIGKPEKTMSVWLQKMRRDRRTGEKVEHESEWLSQFRGPGGLPALPLLDYAVHEKIMVVDGERAIIGGRNLEDRYFTHWLDEELYLEGPIVAQLQKGFLRNFNQFAKSDKKIAQPTALVGDTSPRGNVEAQFVQSQPWQNDFGTLKALVSAIQMARTRIWASSQYIILPSSLLRDALIEAATRGVDVRVLTNSLVTGQEVGFAAGYYISMNYIDDLIHAGVRVFEINGNPEPNVPQPYFHTKEYLFDGEITAIGSFNLSIRSCYIESENLVFLFDNQLTAQQEAVFMDRQTQNATEITEERFRAMYEQHRSKIEMARYVELLY